MTRFTLLLLLSSLYLSGCTAPLVIGVGAATTGAIVASDRRTTGTMLDDERIESKTAELVAQDEVMKNNSNVNATCFNGQLLLTGEVPDQLSSDNLERQAARLARVRMVKNALVVGPVSDEASRKTDSSITRNVKSRLLTKGSVALSRHIKVVTESGTVYLMGLVNRDEAAQAVELTKQVEGVLRIVKVFEYQI